MNNRSPQHSRPRRQANHLRLVPAPSQVDVFDDDLFAEERQAEHDYPYFDCPMCNGKESATLVTVEGKAEFCCLDCTVARLIPIHRAALTRAG
jgi:hypothetical protein